MDTTGNSAPGRTARLRRAFLLAPLVPFVWLAVPAAGYGWAGLAVAAVVIWGSVAAVGVPVYALMRRFGKRSLMEYLAAAAIVAALDTLLMSFASAGGLSTFSDYYPWIFPPMLIGGLLFWFLVERRGRDGDRVDRDQ